MLLPRRHRRRGFLDGCSPRRSLRLASCSVLGASSSGRCSAGTRCEPSKVLQIRSSGHGTRDRGRPRGVRDRRELRQPERAHARARPAERGVQSQARRAGAMARCRRRAQRRRACGTARAGGGIVRHPSGGGARPHRRASGGARARARARPWDQTRVARSRCRRALRRGGGRRRSRATQPRIRPAVAGERRARSRLPLAPFAEIRSPRGEGQAHDQEDRAQQRKTRRRPRAKEPPPGTKHHPSGPRGAGGRSSAAGAGGNDRRPARHDRVRRRRAPPPLAQQPATGHASCPRQSSASPGGRRVAKRAASPSTAVARHASPSVRSLPPKTSVTRDSSAPARLPRAAGSAQLAANVRFCAFA